ncbi:hypothetical protein XELAEV_18018904mg [Xenopus laevis]|uniref:C-type lectin domain-containing protein n=1 Tax=Xenopus laevis TaxID=8355 RepID=A0A974DEF4_XENLA|nr:hypothetical protein XELAEV_18018904mg [Xenopus laevis]
MLELKQNNMETKREYSALSSQMLEIEKNFTETRNEVLSGIPIAQVEMEERLMAEITKLKEDIRRSYGECQKEWKLIGSTLYYISVTTLTWEESKNVCIAMGSSLLILKNQKEMVQRYI